MQTSPNNIVFFRRPGRRGFSFIEILFALFILGIGLTMVAAVFPVAIQQTQAAVDQTTGIAVVEEGRRYMEKFVREQFLKPYQYNLLCTSNTSNKVQTSMVLSLNSGQLKNTLGQNRERVSQIDPRFAWVPYVYFPPQDTTSLAGSYQTPPDKLHVAWVYILPVQAGSKSAIDISVSNELAALTPQSATATLSRDNYGTSFIRFSSSTNNRATDGTYVLVANTTASGTQLRGTYYRLAFTTDGGTTWQLTLDKELPLAPGASVAGATVLLMGRSLRNPALAFNSSSNPYDGPPVDVAVPNIGPFPVTFTRK